MRMMRSAAASARQRRHTPSVSSAVIAPRCRAVVRLSGRALGATSTVGTPAAAIASAAVSPAGPPPTTATSVRFDPMLSIRLRARQAGARHHSSQISFPVGVGYAGAWAASARGVTVNDDRVAAGQQSGHLQRACAFAVHVLTASGAACALLALISATNEEWALMFLWLGLALSIDGLDGTAARYARVSEVLPRWSGDSLDFVVDFVTYVFVPAYAVAQSGLLPDAAAIPAGIIIVVTGAIYFADREMKFSDNCFRG